MLKDDEKFKSGIGSKEYIAHIDKILKINEKHK
jgi:hypothetical protein